MWLVLRGRLQMADNLIRKQWKGSKFCQFYQAEESVNHLMFECPVVVFVWAVIRDAMKWRDVPKSVRDMGENFILLGRGGGGGGGFGVFWLNRNDCVFNNKIVSSPHAILFHLISFLQHWMVVSLGRDRGVLELMVEDFKAQVPEEMVAAGVG
jgi:hypothetical protein